MPYILATVANFDETVEWYGRVLDFEVVEEGVIDGNRWGVIRSGDAMLCIYERAGYKYKNRFHFERQKVHAMRHIGLRFSDRGEWEARMKREGIRLRGSRVVENPHSKSWYIQDPTGHEIEIACWHNDVITFEDCAVR